MSYLDDREAEEAKKATGLDLSGFAPRPGRRMDRDKLAVAQEVSAERGFGRPVEVSANADPTPEASTSNRRSAATAQPAPGPVKRAIVSLNKRAPKGEQGQISLSGDAEVLQSFILRASFERRPRGDLLRDMLALYEEHFGPLPDDFLQGR